MASEPVPTCPLCKQPTAGNDTHRRCRTSACPMLDAWVSVDAWRALANLLEGWAQPGPAVPPAAPPAPAEDADALIKRYFTAAIRVREIELAVDDCSDEAEQRWVKEKRESFAALKARIHPRVTAEDIAALKEASEKAQELAVWVKSKREGPPFPTAEALWPHLVAETDTHLSGNDDDVCVVTIADLAAALAALEGAKR